MADYTIKRGDTLWKLAQKFGTTVDELAKENNIKNVNLIFEGQTISYESEIEKMIYWPDTDSDGKISENDFSNKTFFKEIKSTYKEGTKWTKKIAKEIKDKYTTFIEVQRTKQATLNKISINNDEPITPVEDNFYRNNFDKIFAEHSLNDNKATEIKINISMGSSIKEFRDRKASDFLKKILGDNLNNTSEIEEENGCYKILSKAIEKTDLYKAFISNDVNKGVFTQEEEKKSTFDVFMPSFQGNVRVPSLEANSNGVKYFTLHDENGKILYFDETGKKLNSIADIEKLERNNNKPNIEPQALSKQADIADKTFEQRNNYNSEKINIGKIYLNGEFIEIENLKSNFYANTLDKTFSEITMNLDDENKLEIQIKVGENLKNKWDKSPKDILKKFIGDNFENTTDIENNKLKTNLLDNDNDLYNKFIELNPELNNVTNGKELIVQFPTTKVAPNGEMYFVLIDNDNSPVYFDRKGQKIEIDQNNT